MVTLTTNEIYKMGHELSQSLIKNKVTLKNELNIKVDDESFKKISTAKRHEIRRISCLG